MGGTTVAKRIKIESLETGAVAIAELLEREAPKTCALMWKCLETPMETQGIQAMWVGPELMFAMPESNQKGDPSDLPLEHTTAFPLPGDVVFKYFPANKTLQYYDPLRDKPIWDFFIIYDPDQISSSPCPVWARVIEGLDGLAKAAKRIREEGTKPFRVSRI